MNQIPDESKNDDNNEERLKILNQSDYVHKAVISAIVGPFISIPLTIIIISVKNNSPSLLDPLFYVVAFAAFFMPTLVIPIGYLLKAKSLNSSLEDDWDYWDDWDD